MLALLCLASPPPPAHAASSTVGCGPDRAQRLVEAVQAANTGGPSTVALTPGCTYTFPSSAALADLFSDQGLNALPVITGTVTIAGNGASIVKAERAPGAGFTPFRMTQVNAGATLVLQDLTINRWTEQDWPGGALAVYGGTLTMTNTALLNSMADSGGALHVEGGTATVTNSTLAGNEGWSGGGGISVAAGTVTVTNSTIADNVGKDGGGIGVTGGTVTVTNSAIIRNRACATGGGVHVASGATAQLANVTISGNGAQPDTALIQCPEGQGGLGGGVFVRGTATLTNSTVSGNWTKGWQPRPETFPGTSEAGGLLGWGTVTLTNTIIAKNTRVTEISQTAPSNCLLLKAITDGGNNLQDVNSGCGASIPVHNPRLAGDGGRTSGLDTNGGPTPTVALLAGRPPALPLRSVAATSAGSPASAPVTSARTSPGHPRWRAPCA